MTLQAAFAATMVDEWLRAGITDVVVAPGSRSTPLALAVDQSGLRVHVFLDERSAAFFALGLGLATGRPAPVVVTSGTAAAELHSAAVEAHHARVPLLLCTADRPPELHDVGAPQTIEQVGLFPGITRWHGDLGAVGDLPPSAWRSLAARAVAACTGGPLGPGPVHLNLAFREPLVGGWSELPPGRDGGRPWHVAGGRATATTPLTTGAAVLVSGRTGVVVAGAGIVDPAPVLELAQALGWPVLAAPASRCRGRGSEAAVVSAFDAIIRTPAGDRLRPEAVLRLGSPPASRVLTEWAGGDVVVADPFGVWADPERSAALLVAADPEALCRSLLANGPAPAPDGWSAAWQAAETTAQDAIAGVLAAHPEVTEPGVARAVTSALDGDAALVVASSMPIRDVEWYGDPDMRCRVLANRGANGIDGLVSTALGTAAGWNGPVAALLGDLAFLHDAGGLLGSARRGVDCCLVVVDNDGGGIFGFLPQAGLEPERFERLWGTPQGVDLAALAAVHGIPAAEVTRSADVVPAVAAALEAGGVRLVRVRTDRRANVALHDELTSAVAGALT